MFFSTGISYMPCRLPSDLLRLRHLQARHCLVFLLESCFSTPNEATFNKILMKLCLLLFFIWSHKGIVIYFRSRFMNPNHSEVLFGLCRKWLCPQCCLKGPTTGALLLWLAGCVSHGHCMWQCGTWPSLYHTWQIDLTLSVLTTYQSREVLASIFPGKPIDLVVTIKICTLCFSLYPYSRLIKLYSYHDTISPHGTTWGGIFP